MKSRLTKILIVCVVLILLVIGSVAGYYFLYGQIKAKGIETAKVQGETEFELKKTGRLRSLGNIVVETETERTKLNQFFVTRDGVVDFLVHLETVAKASGVESSLGGLKTSSYSRGGEIAEKLSLEITFRGNWSEDSHFISLLETMPYNLTLENIALRLEGGPVDPIWSGRVLLSVVKFKN